MFQKRKEKVGLRGLQTRTWAEAATGVSATDPGRLDTASVTLHLGDICVHPLKKPSQTQDPPPKGNANRIASIS